MRPRGRHRPEPPELSTLMDDWPRSWAGIDADEPVGAALVAVLRPFMLHLQRQSIAPRTLRRHLDNLWLVGGEIILKLHFDSALRRKSGRALLLEAVGDGEAPLVRGLNE